MGGREMRSTGSLLHTAERIRHGNWDVVWVSCVVGREKKIKEKVNWYFELSI
jgi:hypothetical protein